MNEGYILNGKQQKLDTGELLSLLHDSSSFNDVLDTYSVNMDNPTLNGYLLKLLNEHDCTPAKAIEKTNLSKSFVYQILNGTRVPRRDILLRISFAAGLNMDETQRLLTISHRGLLYPRIRRDAAIIFCLQKQSSLEQANDLLEEIGETPLSLEENR